MPPEWAIYVGAVVALTALGRASPEPRRSVLYLFAFIAGLMLVASIGAPTS